MANGTRPVDCAIDDCPNDVTHRGWCLKHYNRWIRHGNPLFTARASVPSGTSTTDRFWAKVDKSGECWIWTASVFKDRMGYGKFQVGTSRAESRVVYAHRFSWELANGPIPDGLFVLHRCDNPPCVRPDHLWLGTVADNNRDMDMKGRGRHWGRGR